MANPDETYSGPAIAVVGSGPSGCYLAQFLLKQLPAARVTVIDRLPVPYGLVRFGVAPDHQGTKAVTRQFDRMFERDEVRFAGNIDVGTDVSVETLLETFDVVALATGLYFDRRLGIPGEELPNVYRAGNLTRLINAHPDEPSNEIRLGRRTVIVGNGNVAIDVLRILMKAEHHFADTDLDDEALSRIKTPELRAIDVIGRSPATSAKFTLANVRELGHVEGVRFRVDDLPEGEIADQSAARMVAVLRELQEGAQPEPPNIIVNFRFGWTPSNFSGSQLEFVPTDGCGGKLALQTDSVITAIGFIGGEDDCLAQLASGKAWADASIGRIDSRLYCTGWLRRGAQGTIPENRNDARQVAEAIAESLAPANHGWRRGFDGLSRCVVDKAVSFEGWRAIDAIETATASEGRVRRKISNRTELLRIAAEASNRART